MSNTDYFFGTRSTSLGDPKAGLSPDLDAMAAYVSSLNEYPKSHYRQGDGTSTAAGANGRQHFIDLQCFACHGGADFTDSAGGGLHDVGTIKPGSGYRLGGPLTGIDTPTLRGVAYTAPYLHDGSAPDLPSVFNATNAPDGTPHATFRTLNATQQSELISFLLELDGSDVAAPVFRPQINISQSGNSVLLQWLGSATGFSLFSTTNLAAPIVWNPVTNSV